MPPSPLIYIGDDALPHLLDFCRLHKYRRFLLVSDDNTQQVLGQSVADALIAQGYDVLTACLPGPEVIADERHLVQVLVKADPVERVYLAVGSGTLTDITRWVSYKTRSPFISLPTAASVDGFTSVGAPLVVGGLKLTFPAQAPVALFAGLPTLCAAPRPLSAAGYADLLGKFTSMADWELGHLVWDEAYDPAIAARVAATLERCAGLAPAIGRGKREGIEPLMHGLVESGLCMLDFGSSAPASAAEHHISHFWELLLLRQGRPAIFHGHKVGVAALLTAAWYARLRRMDQAQAAERLAPASFGSPEEQVSNLQSIFGPVAGEIIHEQSRFIYMDASDLAALKRRIIERWPEIQATAARVPEPAQLGEWLRAAGAPTIPQELGFNPAEVRQALDYAHYLRPRFTINKLRLLLALPPPDENFTI
jgi:glycerol-1-phosphate dehydrogenase [NAD(P)+]